MADPARSTSWKRLGWIPLAWLVYLAGIPLELAARHAAPLDWAIDLGGMAVFLVLYFRGYGLCGNPGTLNIAAIFVLGALYTSRNPWACAYFIYGAGFVGFNYPSSRTAFKVLGVYLIAEAAVMWLRHVEIDAVISGLVFATLVGAINIRYGEEKRATERLRLAYDQIERIAKVAERERIARDLHDVLGHTLSLIVLKSELAAKLADIDPVRAGTEIRDVERIAREALVDVRATVAGYRSVGVAAELDHAKDVLDAAGVRVESDVEPVRLPAEHESVLALAIREAVTNVVRHAGAHAVRMRLRADPIACRFEIEDDGRGGGMDGFGLQGMRERVESLGGTLERRSDGGTRLAVTLPLAGGATS